jgi:hypothetical protein
MSVDPGSSRPQEAGIEAIRTRLLDGLHLAMDDELALSRVRADLRVQSLKPPLSRAAMFMRFATVRATQFALWEGEQEATQRRRAIEFKDLTDASEKVDAGIKALLAALLDEDDFKKRFQLHAKREIELTSEQIKLGIEDERPFDPEEALDTFLHNDGQTYEAARSRARAGSLQAADIRGRRNLLFDDAANRYAEAMEDIAALERAHLVARRIRAVMATIIPLVANPAHKPPASAAECAFVRELATAWAYCRGSWPAKTDDANRSPFLRFARAAWFDAFGERASLSGAVAKLVKPSDRELRELTEHLPAWAAPWPTSPMPETRDL